MSKRIFSPERRKLLQAAAMLPAANYFAAPDFDLVQELAETIIPADAHSGGAKAAGVAGYIQQVLRNTVDAGQRNLWRQGLRLVDTLSRKQCGKPFVKASPEDRVRVLDVLATHGEMSDVVEVRFFHELKRLVVLGYYTSKVGILDELEYKGNQIHKEFSGCGE